MKKIFTLLVFALPVALFAQTYFYIDQIAVSPSSPTDQDNVSIDLVGNLSDGDAYIASAMASVSGTTVTIDIEANSQGGIGVLIPHTESFPVGMLAAGTYDIVLNTIFVLDGAPAPQHQFTVTGLGTNVEELEAKQLNVRQLDNTLILSGNDGSAIGPVVLIDLNGKQILSEKISGITGSVDIGPLPSGAYLLQHAVGVQKLYIE